MSDTDLHPTSVSEPAGSGPDHDLDGADPHGSGGAVTDRQAPGRDAAPGNARNQHGEQQPPPAADADDPADGAHRFTAAAADIPDGAQAAVRPTPADRRRPEIRRPEPVLGLPSQPGRPTGPGQPPAGSSAAGQFAVALRGYDRSQVDIHVTELERRLLDLSGRWVGDSRELGSLRVEVAGLRRDHAQAVRDLEESREPTYAGLGARVEQLLRLAEEEARSIGERAHAEAERLVADSRELAGRIRGGAEDETAELRAVAIGESEETVRRADVEAEAVRDAASGFAEELRAAVDREIRDVRAAAHGDARGIREAAQRDAEARTVSAERAAAELVGTAGAEAEQLRRAAKTDTDAQRAEAGALLDGARAEAGLLRSQTAMDIARSRDEHQRAETTRLEAVAQNLARRVAEVDEHVRTGEERVRIAAEESERMRRDSEARARALEQDARRGGERHLVEAQAAAEETLRRAREEADRLLADAQRRVGDLDRQHERTRRSLEQLRSVLAGTVDSIGGGREDDEDETEQTTDIPILRDRGRGAA